MRRFKVHFKVGLVQGLLLVGAAVLLSGCSAEEPVAAQNPGPPVRAAESGSKETPTLPTATGETNRVTATPEATPTPEPTGTATSAPPTATQDTTATPDYTATPDTRPVAAAWRTWAVIPEVSARAVEIYRQGLAMGNDPRTFSIIGDCQSEPPVFFGIYDTERYYFNEDSQYLQETVDWFTGNFGRVHVTVKNGLSVASVFSPMWADKTLCNAGETPLDCEFRLRKPSIVFINLGTNWTDGNGFGHGQRMRELVDYVLAKGALPILSTKGDNHEGDHSINLSITEIAREYDIPLWNFWLAIQDLEDHGLDNDRKDKNYLTVEAWNVRSFTGLRVLDRVWRQVNGMEMP